MTDNILEGLVNSAEEAKVQILNMDETKEESESIPEESSSNDEVETQEQQTEESTEPDEPLSDPTNADWAKARIAQREENKRHEADKRAMQTQIDEMRGQMQGANNYQQQQQDRQQEQANQQKTIDERNAYLESKPDKYDDGYEDWLRNDILGEVRKAYAPLEEQFNKQNEISERQRQINQSQSYVSNIESDYSKIDKNYNDAKEFLINSRVSEFKVLNPNATEQQAMESVNQELLYTAGDASRNNINIAQTFKQMAEVRGFVAKEVSQTKTKIASNNRRNSINLINKTGTTVRDSNTISMEEVSGMDMQSMMNFDKELLKLAKSL